MITGDLPCGSAIAQICGDAKPCLCNPPVRRYGLTLFEFAGDTRYALAYPVVQLADHRTQRHGYGERWLHFPTRHRLAAELRFGKGQKGIGVTIRSGADQQTFCLCLSAVIFCHTGEDQVGGELHFPRRHGVSDSEELGQQTAALKFIELAGA